MTFSRSPELPVSSALHRSRAHQIVAGVVALLSAAIGFAPLFGGPGYESSLATGIFLPSIVAVLAATDLVSKARQPFDAFCRAVATGAALAGVAFVVSCLHGLRVGFCDPWAGFESFALGPGVGSLVAGAWGWVASEIAGAPSAGWPRKLAVAALALAAPLGSIAVSVGRFYASPMIFAFDPFVGYFSGSIYDTVVDLSPLLTYRVGSVATLFAGFVCSLHLARDERGRIHYESIGRPGLLLLGVASFAASVVVTGSGAKLGHYQTPATISEALGASLHGERCDAVYPRSFPEEDAARLLRECDEHVRENEAWLGVSGTPHITAYFFESSSQKARLMGAAGTQIAKPWRHEVYVQVSGYPHHSLGHEVMHVVAGDAARGPFRVAGSLGGLLPNPGLIEGVAVASNPDEDDLSPADWAKAMKDLKILPPLSRLFAFGFFGENSNTAYTVSGAFVGFIHERYGRDAVAAWYRGGDLRSITRSSWAELESAWHDELDQHTLSEAAYFIAKARFDRPAIFGRRCPRVVDACRERGDGLAAEGDPKGAIVELERAKELDPNDPGLSLDLARQWGMAGDPARSRREVEAIANDDKLDRNARDKAIEELADEDLQRGAIDDAVRRYEDVASRTIDQSKKRTLLVKELAARSTDYREALVTLLIGKAGRRPDRGRAYEMLAALEVRLPDDGLASYLLARHDLDGRDYDLAATRLDRVLSKHGAIPEVGLEAKRLRVIVACARGEGAVARRVLGDYAKDPLALDARVSSLRRLVDRCAGPAPP